MGSRLIGLAALAGCLAVVPSAFAAPPTAPPDSFGIRLVGVAAGSRDSGLSRSYIVERLAPGADVMRLVEISNNTSTFREIEVYPAAAGLRRGRFEFGPGHRSNELSHWTSVDATVLGLSPGSKRLVAVRIHVPSKTFGGERYAVIWAQLSEPAATPGGVTLVNRVGIRMYVTVDAGGSAPARFSIGSPIAKRSSSGTPFVVAQIHNRGRSTLEIQGTLDLDQGPGGLRAGPLPVTLTTRLAPHSSANATVRLAKQLPRGPWRVRMRLRSGSTVRTAVATLEFPEAQSMKKTSSVLLVASVAAGLMLLLAISAVALMLNRRRTTPL